MRIKKLPWILYLVSIILFSSYTMNYPGGAPAAKTGSPGDGSNCSSCHGGTATTTTGQITSNIPADGYVPGQTYQITATNPLTGSGKYGFEVSPQNIAGIQLGTLAAGTGSKLVGGTKYVTQSSANSSTHVWTFSWIAPVAGTGAVTFYGAFARNYTGATTLSTLTVQEGASTPAAAGPITGSAAVCINNTETYSVGSIAGATSYVWTAPPGASILSGQGTSTVSVSYSAAAISGNISVYGSNAAGNGAASNKLITVNSIPDQTSAIAGDIAPCQASSQTYSVSNVPGITYTWGLPPGSVLSSGQGTNSVNVTIGSTNGDITVIPSNICGAGAPGITTLAVSPLPLTPATPDGPAQVIAQNTPMSDYTTTSVADSYIWQLDPVAAGSISGTAATAQVTWNSTFSGNASVTVISVNSCGESAPSPVKTTQVLNTAGFSEHAAGIKVITTESEGSFTLVMNTDVIKAKVMLLDLSGRVLLNTTVAGQGTQLINHQLKAGLYIILIDAGSSKLKKKILVI